MATARLSRETYEKLVKAFREQPGNVSHAIRAAKVGPRTARRAWMRGWDAPSWARPIQDVFAQEQIQARASLERKRAEKGARIRDDRERVPIHRPRQKQGRNHWAQPQEYSVKTVQPSAAAQRIRRQPKCNRHEQLARQVQPD